jgi:hypothetical protein
LPSRSCVETLRSDRVHLGAPEAGRDSEALEIKRPVMDKKSLLVLAHIKPGPSAPSAFVLLSVLVGSITRPRRPRFPRLYQPPPLQLKSNVRKIDQVVSFTRISFLSATPDTFRNSRQFPKISREKKRRLLRSQVAAKHHDRRLRKPVERSRARSGHC